MLYCPHCRHTYSSSDLALFLLPLSCSRCGNKRLIRWDRVYRARRETFGLLEERLVMGGRM